MGDLLLLHPHRLPEARYNDRAYPRGCRSGAEVRGTGGGSLSTGRRLVSQRYQYRLCFDICAGRIQGDCAALAGAADPAVRVLVRTSREKRVPETDFGATRGSKSTSKLRNSGAKRTFFAPCLVRFFKTKYL